jgi:hypothetical protein
LGWRAPAARQVHDPSAVWLVSSISIRRDMRRTTYRAGPCGLGTGGTGPNPAPTRHPVTWQDVRGEAGAAWADIADGPAGADAAHPRPSGGST